MSDDEATATNESRPAVGAPVEPTVRPRYWMTREAEYRLKNGGNAKGAVPVHARPSVAAKIPLYGQAELDAAVAAERERCAKLCEATGEVAADMYGDGAECRQTAGMCADAIRSA